MAKTQLTDLQLDIVRVLWSAYVVSQLKIEALIVHLPRPSPGAHARAPDHRL